jgi:hypothetical protein
VLKKTFLFALIITISIVACTEESEDNDIPPNQLDKIEISSFKILENSVNGITTETKVLVESTSGATVNDHGVFVLKNNEFYDKIVLGELSETTFITTVSSGLERGQNYDIYPYIYAKGTFFYGDTLNFESIVEIDFELLDWYPKQAFVNDTISFIGKNFCSSSETIKNGFSLNGANQKIIFESDSLVKAVILPNMQVSELGAALETCGTSTSLEPNFIMTPPVFDSISPKEAYLGESFFIYGKNFHSEFSKVWIDDYELVLINNNYTDKIEVKVAEDFPVGLLDLRIQVLDRAIEKQNYFQSTIPVIDELDNRETGFLDTLTVKGDYLLQKNKPLEVFVGGRQQHIIDSSKTEIKIVIDTYFEDENPTLVVKTGEFELSEKITMLPPQIISVDKDLYHLYDENITIKTKYFLGFKSNIKIGRAECSNNSYDFEPIDSQGNLTISLTKWLDATAARYPKFEFDGQGELKIELTTDYGVAEKNFKIYSPEIKSISSDIYYHGNQIGLNGLDFGYRDVSTVYVDGEEFPFSGNSNYSLYNTSIAFPVPSNLLPGTHTIKVVTGGQESNEVSFVLGDVSVTEIQSGTGTRNDVYTMEGTNLDQVSKFGFKLNGISCTLINATKNQAQIILPYFIPLTGNDEIIMSYGDENRSIGFINGIEPYEKLEEYQQPSELNKFSKSFEHNGKLYALTYGGIYEFNQSTLSWSLFESNIPNLSNYTIVNYTISVVGEDIYVFYFDKFLVYNMQSRTWKEVGLIILDGLSAVRGTVYGEYAYLWMKRPENFSDLILHKYDLNLNTYVVVNQPVLKNTLQSPMASNIYQKDGFLFLDVLDDNIMMYDMVNDSWENIGFPKGLYTFHYHSNLYMYNNILYYSGGRGNEAPEQYIFAYDFSTRTWTEKTPMLLTLINHSVYGLNNKLYFGLGAGIYGYDNYEMIRYDIANDPY